MSGAGTRRRLVVEADGGSRGNPGVAGYGALVRDPDTCEVLAERAAPLGTASNNVAEYSGLIAGLEAADEVAAEADVEVRMDSKLVIEQMSGRWKIKHEDMRRLAEVARGRVAGRTAAGGSVRFTWVPRERNKAADRLSNVGMDGKTVRRLGTPRPAVSAGGPERETEPGPEPAEPEPHQEPEPPHEPETVAIVADFARSARSVPVDRGAGVRLVLVRHGVTDSNASGQMDGRGGLDLDLNAEGTRQAQLAARGVRAFLGAAPVHVITSTLARARQTGQFIAAELGVPAKVDEDWDELHFGDWNGRTTRELAHSDPQGLQALWADSSSSRPGGESRDQLDARVARAVDRAVRGGRDAGSAVVVIAHRGALVAALRHLVGITSRQAGSFDTGPASLTSVKSWADGTVLVEFVNDRSHLRPG